VNEEEEEEEEEEERRATNMSVVRSTRGGIISIGSIIPEGRWVRS